MRFKLLAVVAALLVAVGDYFLLPPVLIALRSNPQIQSYKANPDLTFEVVSQCKKSVVDTAACYQAYSAAVQLSNIKGCSTDVIAMKRRFKLLVEHNLPEVIENEIIRECTSIKN